MSCCPFNEEQLSQLKMFIEICKSQPQILNHPKITFFKDYITSLGGTIPAATFGAKPFTASGDNVPPSNNNAEKIPSSDEESEPESDVELDMEGVIEPDVLDDSQVMGDQSKETTDEERDQSDEKRSAAMRAFSEQNFDEAIKLYTEAIQLNPQSALLFAKRGQVYLKLNKPNACIKDCTQALELNCDSAAAYKFRGRAYRLLGKFEEASHDLCESLKIDYDDQTNEWLQEVKPNAEKLRQHKLTVQRKKEEKEHADKVRRARKAQEARARAAQAQQDAPGFPGAGAFPGGFPGAVPRGQAGGMPDIASLISDPEIMALIQDPDVANAFQDVSANPANFVKYQNNPKVAAAIEKLQSKFFSSAAAGGFGGAPGAGAGAADDDVGLD
ncbi:hsc70-interacting protein-like [Leguminivora glycinivorella]|uniref:hsc70-interacting protein-like n=1 Tax=Leguminivora glycinivorella TaxID=1035111 RepID=UPI00200C73D0|nr:hsc70-interacting protein-like [Leguminivora glycinivorella]XP_047991584.1 hsc70-interacting protein-like [Leguminivora glycinivorella]